MSRSAINRSTLQTLVALLALVAWIPTFGAGPVLAAEPTDSGVVGSVVDAETGKPLAFATVMLTPVEPYPETPEGGVGANSRGDGSYRVFAHPGTYTLQVSYLGYQKMVVKDVVVKAGAFETLNASLTPSAVSLKTVEVTAKKVHDTEAALLSVQKKAGAVSDAIGAEQIKKSTDSNAAEVLTRVTGMSVVGGRYVYVRGLGERYSMTQVNGSMIGSPEPNKRVVPLDLFPADLLDNVSVQKTYTPDQPGEFAGGIVNVNTRDFPGEKVWSVSFAPGYKGSTTGRAFETYSGRGRWDFLGLSGGSRDLPGVVESWAAHRKVARRSPYDPNGTGFSGDSLETMGEAFNRSWSPRRATARPAINFAGSYGDEIDLFGRPLGFIAGVSVNNGLNTSRFSDNSYQGTSESLVPMTSYDGRTSTANSLWGTMLNASYRLGDANMLRLRGMYNRSAEDEVRTYEGDNTDISARLRDTRLRYVERGILTSTIGMDHALKALLNSKLQWQVNYSQAQRDETDRRESVYEAPLGDAGAEFHLSGRFPLNRLYSYMDDYDRVYQADWTIPFSQWAHHPSSLKVGYLRKNKDRAMNLRRFIFKTQSVDLSAPPESLLTNETISGGSGTGQFALEEVTRATDSYRAAQDLDAEYFMVDMPLVPALRLVTGVRWEMSDQRTTTLSPFLSSDSLVVASIKTTDALPSVNLTWSPRPAFNLRGAWSRTVSRPDLRELTPFELTDFVSGFAESGNPRLKRARIQNEDLRAEFYPSPRELLAVSIFHKHFQDPIEVSIGNQPALQRVPVNGAGGWVKGVELEARVGLGRVSPSLGSLGLNGNLTLVKSRAKLDQATWESSRQRPLQGQSPYVANLGLFYNSKSGHDSAALLYNVFGKRLAGIGYVEIPHIYEMPRHSLDATVSHAMGGTRMKLSVENILNNDTRYEQGGLPQSTTKNATSVSLSLSYGTR
jgi:outer membrane receptor protein involved in Fe transport